MIKSTLEKLPLTTIIIAYFFICGLLYIIGFWSTFDIDITNFVSLTDIPKSFVLPFVLSQGIFLFHVLAYFILFPSIKDGEEKPKVMYKRTLLKRILIILVHPDTLFAYLVSFIFITIKNYKSEPLFWYFSSLLIGTYLIYRFTKSTFIKNKIPYFITRLFVGYFICLLPIFSFSTGKILSLNTFKNQKIVYVNNLIDNNVCETNTIKIKKDENKYKLLGFLGDKLIISTLDNKKIIIINQSTFKSVELSLK